MIYQYVKRYLKHTFKNPDENFKYTPMDDIRFIKYVEKRYTLEEFVKNISEVKEAFKDFFEPIGTIVFRYKSETGVRFKVFPYRVEPKDSKYLNTLVKIIHKNRKYIETPYDGHDDQIGILGKIRRAINSEINDIDESVNKKELIKFAIKKSLELKDSDVIVQLKRMYIVKIANEENSKEEYSEDIPIKSGDDRYNGYTKEQIQNSYDDIFSKISIDNFLVTTMRKAFKNKLDFTSIDNRYYERNALKIISFQITNELSDYSSLENDFLKGIASYILRGQMHKIHELIAVKLLQEVHDKNLKAEEFLLYYNGEVIVENKKRYKIPALVTSDGKQWSNSSIVGICSLWITAMNKKESYEAALQVVDKKIKHLNKVLSSVELRKAS